MAETKLGGKEGLVTFSGLLKLTLPNRGPE